MNNSRTPVVVGVVAAIGVLIGLNIMQQRNEPKTEQQLQQQQEEEARKQAANASPTAAATPGAAPTTEENRLTDLGETMSIGPKSAATEIVVGWQWTPEVQADPAKVTRALASIRSMVDQSGGRLRARFVNTDADPTVAPGVTVAGKVRVALGEDGSIPTESIMPAVAGSMK